MKISETEKDLENSGKDDQITSVSNDMESKPSKPKKEDPKKVAAGKATAKKNKEAREALKNSQNKEIVSPISPLSFLDVNNGLQMTAGLIGSCFVIYHGYRFFYPPKEESKLVHEMVVTNQVEEPAPVKEPKQKQETNIDME